MNATTRFSDRVANYIKYRPSYPAEIVSFMVQTCGLTSAHTVVDVGSGTGKLTELFLQHGCRTIAVEPNGPMRLAAEALLAGDTNFVSVDGSAENSTLPDNSADFIIAGQAFHWFDPIPTRNEFARILKPNGWVALIWNERLQSNPFQHAYDQFLHEHAINYAQVNHRNISAERISNFFHPATVQLTQVDYAQSFDFEGLKGRSLSSSYTPNADHPHHPTFVAALRTLFDAHAIDGQVAFAYQTKLFYAQFA